MRVELRPITEDDRPMLFKNQSDPIAAAMVGFPSREWDEYIEHSRKVGADPDAVTRAIVADGVLVGDIVSWSQDGDREVGYWIDRAHWGHGIGIIYLPVGTWVRAFLGLGTMYLVTSSFVLAKCVRDAQESTGLAQRLDQARVDKILAEHDPFAAGNLNH